MRRVAIILARGGSKRIPRKNIKSFHGKPIIGYVIAAARSSGCFAEVVTSTDDQEITRVAIDSGCHQVIHRPAELADDHATTAAAMAHAVSHLRRNGQDLEHVCCLYPCTPFVEPADLQAGLELLLATGSRYAFPVVQFDVAPQRMMRRDDRGLVRTVWPQFDLVRTQDLEPRWHDAGQWYWGCADAWLGGEPIFGERSAGLPMPRLRAIDIDTAEDWALAETIYAEMVQSRIRSDPFAGLQDRGGGLA